MSSSSDPSYRILPSGKEVNPHDEKKSAKDSPNLQQPAFELKHFRRSEYGRQTTYDPLSNGNTELSSPPPWSAVAIISHSFSGYAIIAFACTRIATATLQLSLLVYLQLAYLALPRTDTGQFPRVEGIYATFPFISCIGSAHLSTYQGFTVVIVILGLTTDATIFYRARFIEIGYWFRRINMLASLLAYALALWLSFAAKNASTRLHLFIIAIHSLAVLTVKISSLATDHCLREAYPALRFDPVAIMIRRWKEATVWFALPMAILLNTGVYSCRDTMNDDITTPGTTCYRVPAIAAPADWLYALVAANWSIHMGYEAFKGPHVDQVVKASKASAAIYGSPDWREEEQGMMNSSDNGQDGQRSGWDRFCGADYKALGTKASFRSTLWDAEHPEIDVEDVPVAVMKEMV